MIKYPHTPNTCGFKQNTNSNKHGDVSMNKQKAAKGQRGSMAEKEAHQTFTPTYEGTQHLPKEANLDLITPLSQVPISKK